MEHIQIALKMAEELAGTQYEAAGQFMILIILFCICVSAVLFTIRFTVKTLHSAEMHKLYRTIRIIMNTASSFLEKELQYDPIVGNFGDKIAPYAAITADLLLGGLLLLDSFSISGLAIMYQSKIVFMKFLAAMSFAAGCLVLARWMFADASRNFRKIKDRNR